MYFQYVKTELMAKKKYVKTELQLRQILGLKNWFALHIQYS